MIWIVFTVGSIINICCLAIIVAPKLLRLTIDFFSLGSRLYVVALARMILGTMLLILAPQARLWWYVVIIGLICTTSGFSFFFFPLRRTKKILTRLQNQSNLFLRLWTFLGLVMWIFLFYALTAAVPMGVPR